MPISLRIYPHLQDTGGFFVAIIQKKPSVPRTQPVPEASKELSYVHSVPGMPSFFFPLTPYSRDAKRTADAVEGLDRADVKKPKLDNHYYKCHSSVTCVDCSTTFGGPKEWKSHTQCISEAEKYQKGLYKGKKSVRRLLW